MYKGQLKNEYWAKGSEGQVVKEAFMRDCRGDDDGGPEVISDDAIAEAWETSTLPNAAGDSEVERSPDDFIRR